MWGVPLFNNRNNVYENLVECIVHYIAMIFDNRDINDKEVFWGFYIFREKAEIWTSQSTRKISMCSKCRKKKECRSFSKHWNENAFTTNKLKGSDISDAVVNRTTKQLRWRGLKNRRKNSAIREMNKFVKRINICFRKRRLFFQKKKHSSFV